MLPKFLMPKAIKPPDVVQHPKFPEEIECCNCFNKFPIKKSFIVLIDGEDKFKAVCQNCSNVRGLGKITYLESYEVYCKRQKVNFFKDWKVKAYEKN